MEIFPFDFGPSFCPQYFLSSFYADWSGGLASSSKNLRNSFSKIPDLFEDRIQRKEKGQEKMTRIPRKKGKNHLVLKPASKESNSLPLFLVWTLWLLSRKRFSFLYIVKDMTLRMEPWSILRNIPDSQVPIQPFFHPCCSLPISLIIYFTGCEFTLAVSERLLHRGSLEEWFFALIINRR